MHAHLGSQVFEARFFEMAVDALAPFFVEHPLAELSIGGGLGVAYVEGEEAPSITEWADAVHRACARAGHHRPGDRRAGPGHRGRGGRHPLHGRDHQGAARHPHLRLGRRRDERQPATGALRQRLRDVPGPGGGGRSTLGRCGWSASTASRATCWCARAGCRPTWRWATSCARRSPGPTATRWARTTTRCLRPAVVFVADGAARLVVRRETFDDLLRLRRRLATSPLSRPSGRESGGAGLPTG